MRGVKHYSRDEILAMINDRDKTTKHELASMRANFAEWLYNNSEPIPTNEDAVDRLRCHGYD